MMDSLLATFLGNLNLVMALVANKSDLEAKREVDNEVVATFC